MLSCGCVTAGGTILRRTRCGDCKPNGAVRGRHAGIALGCPLSPLMGALYLKPFDEAVGATGLFYAQFVDDWVVLAPSRWRLRRCGVW